MQIVIVGDYQLENTPLKMTENAMEDIRNTESDLVVVMGDYGKNAELGDPDTIFRCKKLLDLTESFIRPLLGNHDFHKEIGENILPHGTMEKAMRKAFEIDDTFFVYEHKEFRLFGISLDSWSAEPPLSVNECFVSDERFGWIVRKIEERPGIPIVMLTHAPIMGCGLRTVPGVHIRATNAYMDQSTDPMRWIALTEHPEIILWLSAHYHLGHHHPDSLVERKGVVYAHTGVHGNVTRDGRRQSRILHIEDDRIILRTLDHENRSIQDKPDWEASLSDMYLKRKEICPRVLHPNMPDWLESFEPLGAGGRKSLPDGHVLLSTRDNYLWEADPQWAVVLGTLHYQDEKIIDYCVSGDVVWRAFGQTISAVNIWNPWRFTRERFIPNHHEEKIQLQRQVNKLEPIAAGGVRVFLEDGFLNVNCPERLK